MCWKRKERKAAMPYEPLATSSDKGNKHRASKGYVPVLVGCDDGSTERFQLHVSLLKAPCIVELLEMSAQEFGYRQEGILRILCDTEDFRRVVDVISKGRRYIEINGFFK